MNKICRYIGMALMGLLTLASCSPDDIDSPNGQIPNAADYADNVVVTVDQTTNYAYFNFKSAPGVSPVWIINGISYDGNFTVRKYYRKAGDYTVECKVKNANGISDGTITKTFTIDKTIMNGFGGFDPTYEHNLYAGAAIHGYCNYYNPDPNWGNEITEGFPVTQSDRNFTLTLSKKSYQQWQAQFFIDTDINISSASTYDFSVLLTSSTDHPSATVKVCEIGSGTILLNKEGIELTAGEPLCVWASELPGFDTSAGLQVVFDFGGNEENTEVNIEDIVIKDHQYDDGTVVPDLTVTEPVWVSVGSAENLWNAITSESYTYYYACGADWAQYPDPTMVKTDGVYCLSLPQPSTLQWQAQFAIVTDLACDDATQEYDFRVTLESNNDVSGATVKLTQSDNDDNYFFAGNIDLPAEAQTRFWVKQVKAKSGPMPAIKLVFDFGGNPANTEIRIKDIIFQKHKE